MSAYEHVPVIDVSTLAGNAGGAGDGADAVAGAIDAACRDTGFFAIVGHGVAAELRTRLDALAREFFALGDEEKAQVAMAHGGRAWRGWFPVGGELTAGVPDRKEGMYLGAELGPEDPRVRARLPLHGANLFPERPAGLRAAILEYLDALTGLGHAVLRGVARALALDPEWFARGLTADPLVLFRMFHYPPAAADASEWGVAEHTDYGLLTILMQDDAGGLQVRSRGTWVDVPPIPDSFVCNIGDMLERMTAGVYRSTPHRVRSPDATDRYSYAFFFDPAWDAEVRAVPSLSPAPPADADERWDHTSVHELRGTYGEYLLAKVSKVFPELADDVI